jgi:23S rRNA pseudouridine2605 synthase
VENWKQALEYVATMRTRTKRAYRMPGTMPQNRVTLNRALSKLGILSRSGALAAIRAGRVRVNGRVETDPACLVVPERVRIEIDEIERPHAVWRTLLFHKPRGIVTTRRDPEGRPTIYDLLGEAERALIAVGRLDLATSGLLLLTSDTALAHRLTDPARAVPRVYIVTVRGRIEDASIARLMGGMESHGDRLQPSGVTLRKRSGRESHLTVELREGKNREVRRLFEAVGHQVTRLKRVQFGRLELGNLAPGEWRELSRAEVARAFEV